MTLQERVSQVMARHVPHLDLKTALRASIAMEEFKSTDYCRGVEILYRASEHIRQSMPLTLGRHAVTQVLLDAIRESHKEAMLLHEIETGGAK